MRPRIKSPSVRAKLIVTLLIPKGHSRKTSLSAVGALPTTSCSPAWYSCPVARMALSAGIVLDRVMGQSALMHYFVTESLTNRQLPKGLEKDVHALLRLLPDYNRILGENRDIEVKDLVAEDLEKVMTAATASNKLYYRAYSNQLTVNASRANPV
ncbi:hypothetical protein NA56DRAFT_666743 [Hyaloscypha hepaticicola]|uniref:Uncharacterized protein n=1 Tax=Hyaloscypha hepaticicola TaxID=2082293 RepID=A0A2J6PD56_9HELO|nr:hypothetical protein NA56DRAFT_666743 [Hyaloscypha hepaticicola]